MALKQRKGKSSKKEQSKDVTSSPNGTDNDDKKKRSKKSKQFQMDQVAKKKKQQRYKKTISGKQALLFVAAVLTIAGAILHHFYKMYGPTMFLGIGWMDYKVEPYQWRKFLDSHEKTLLLIGGPHRSGTTIVWKAITSHPEVVGFGDTFVTGADYSEGILIQDVYSAYGVGMEFRKGFAGAGIKKVKGEDDVDISNGGLGQYALLPENYVHLTKTNHKGKLDDPNNFSKLMNRFTPFWDNHAKYGGKDGLQKAKVWVEKSPQNIVLSTFLEGMYNMPIQEDGTIDVTPERNSTAKKTVTKFLFMTRHPIANVLATDIFIQEAMGGFRDFEVLLRNYIQMHKYAKADEKNLDSPYLWVKLEDFTSNPAKTLKRVMSFLDVPDNDESINFILEEVGTIQTDPNAKYFKKWCEKELEIHKELVPKYNDQIKALGLGYDLTSVCS